MPITPIASASEAVAPPLKAYDIWHVPREENLAAAAMMAAAAGEVNRDRPIRSGRFKRPGARTKAHQRPPAAVTVECCNEESNKSLSHQSELGVENAKGGGGDRKETKSNSMASAETTTTVAKPSQPVKAEPETESEVGLELTLGVKPVSHESLMIPVKERRSGRETERAGWSWGFLEVEDDEH